MRVTLISGTETIPLSGEAGVSQRTHSEAVEFAVEATAEVDIIRGVRAEYALPIDRGNLRTQIQFSSQRQFPTAAEAEVFCADYDEKPREGEVEFDTGGGKRKLLAALVLPTRLRPLGAAALITYVALGTVIEEVPDAPEYIIPAQLDDPLFYRIVEEGDEKWFEVGFDSPVLLTGSAADGWTEPAGCLTVRLERSENLTAWDHDWIPCPTSPETISGGYRYWGRSKYPQDSKVKTGMLEVSSGPTYGKPFSTPGNISPDTRNNPFTSLTILGESRALGGFPYTMPADASRMQTDLAAIFPGATVVAVDAVNWRIRIPNITFSQYQQVNKVFWPVYYVADIISGVNVPVDGAYFAGQFVNTAGVRTSVFKQFARDRLSPGPNYPW